MNSSIDLKQVLMGVPVWTHVTFDISNNSLYIRRVSDKKLILELSLSKIVAREDHKNPLSFYLKCGQQELNFKAKTIKEAKEYFERVQKAKESNGIELQRLKSIRETGKEFVNNVLDSKSLKKNSSEINDSLAKLCEIESRLACLISRTEDVNSDQSKTKLVESRKLMNSVRKEFENLFTSVDQNITNLVLVEDRMSLLDPKLHIKKPHVNLNNSLKRILDDSSIIEKYNLNESSIFTDANEDADELAKIRESFAKSANHNPSTRFINSEPESKLLSHEVPILLSADLQASEENTLGVTNSLVSKLLKTNQSFKKYPVEANLGSTRDSLPALRSPNERLPIFKLLSSVVGQNLTRVSIPCFVNEPLSALHRGAQSLTSLSHLRRANRAETSIQRTMHALSVPLQVLIDNLERVKKPFNPLLGETFEHSREDAIAIVEQVSHHPPISAFYVDCQDATVEGNFETFMSFSFMKGFEMKFNVDYCITAKATKERFTFKYCQMKINNLLMGKPYLYYTGRLECLNEVTNDVCYIEFPPENSDPNRKYEVRGEAKNANGETQFELSGFFNSKIYFNRPGEQEKQLLLERATDFPLNYQHQFNFTSWVINQNHLYPELLAKLPPTDVRLRPDLHAFERGDLDLAESEKQRLETKQRLKRSEMLSQGVQYKPFWFEQKEDTVPKFKFNGKYFSCREQGAWPDDIPDIF